MTPELVIWLENRWRTDNHTKYRHLFGEWLSNLTVPQMNGFEKQMYNDVNNVLR